MFNEFRAIEYQESTVSEGGIPRGFDEPEGWTALPRTLQEETRKFDT